MKMKNVLPAVSIALLGLNIFLVFGQNKLAFFVLPTHIPYVVFAAVFFLLVAALHFFQSKKVHVHCAHDEVISSKYALWIFILPLVLTLFVAPKPLSSATAISRGINEELPVTRFMPGQIFSFSISPEKRSLIDWVRTFHADPEPKSYKGQRAHLTGFVLKDQLLPNNTFQISQFFISCCAADARPLAIPVRVKDQTVFDSLKENEWVEITGVLGEEKIEGERKIIIESDSIKNIPVPDQPYAY